MQFSNLFKHKDGKTEKEHKEEKEVKVLKETKPKDQKTHKEPKPLKDQKPHKESKPLKDEKHKKHELETVDTNRTDSSRHFHFFRRSKQDANLPKGFANDVTRTTNKPDTLYGFDDPTARRLGPVPTEDPTNTGA